MNAGSAAACTEEVRALGSGLVPGPAHLLRPAARDDASWVRELSDPGAAGDAARSDLRAALVAGLVRMLRPKRVPEAQCEDFAQEALLRIGARLQGFRGESRFLTWALAVAARLAFDELRHRQWRDVSLEDVDPGGRAERADPAPGQEHALARARVLDALDVAIREALTEKQRTVLVAELNGMPQAEIAARMGMTRNALYKLAHDARRKLRKRLLAVGLDAGDALEAFE